MQVSRTPLLRELYGDFSECTIYYFLNKVDNQEIRLILY